MTLIFTEIWEKKIDNCWNDLRVKKFISGLDTDGRNYELLNYIDGDIYV